MNINKEKKNLFFILSHAGFFRIKQNRKGIINKILKKHLKTAV